MALEVWCFKQFVSPEGTRPVEKWYGKKKNLAAKHTLFQLLRIMSRMREWKYPEFRRFTGDRTLVKLGEIRFTVNKTEHRAIGMDGPEQGCYTLLIGCTHKDDVYSPPSAKQTGARRRDMINSGEADAEDFRYF